MADEEQKKPRKPDEDPVGKVYDSRLMRRLGHYLRPYWMQATISSLAVSLKSLCDVAGPFLVMVAVDRYFPRLDRRTAAGPWLATNWLTRRLPADPCAGHHPPGRHLSWRAALRLSLSNSSRPT